MRRLIIVVACLVFGTTIAQANMFMGQGGVSCGSYVRSARSMPDVLAWVLGYLSAKNKDDPSDFLKQPGLDAGAIDTWIQNWCRSNPLDPVADAATSLEIELYARALSR